MRSHVNHNLTIMATQLTHDALEIVLQHWIVPSNNLQRWGTALAARLETHRLPIVRKALIQSLVAAPSEKGAQSIPTERRKFTEGELKQALDNYKRFLDTKTFASLRQYFSTHTIENEWFSSLQSIQQVSRTI